MSLQVIHLNALMNYGFPFTRFRFLESVLVTLGGLEAAETISLPPLRFIHTLNAASRQPIFPPPSPACWARSAAEFR